VLAARPEHSVVQQAASAVSAPTKPSPALVASNSSVVATSTASHAESAAAAAPRTEPVAAPAPRAAADASAVAPRPAEKSTRVDARTVVSIRSSERVEPLYSVPLPSSRLRLGAPSIADSIVVYKRERTLTLFYRGVPVKSYFVALGSNPVGDKQRAGDQRTPEGLFHVNAHNPASKFHLALRISYPDDAHRARAAAIGADPGGDIMIHGLPPEYSDAGKDHVANDWTNGCVALSNAEIEELWRAVPDGTPVQIKP
jgi:lipoprotein-anchoring transpeptidase ErfK/SrfK